MTTQDKTPKTLMEAIEYFADLDVCHDFVVNMRWPNGVTCIYCGSGKLGYLTSRRKFQCKNCRKQFTVKVGTIFEDSPLPLNKWICALWMLINCKNGSSSYEVGRALGITQKSAWFMLHRLRLILQDGEAGLLSGEVEVDETFIGGKARFMHKGKKEKKIKGATGHMGKTVVMGLLERHGKIKTKVIQNTRRKNLDPLVREHVEPGSTVYTDALASYESIQDAYEHQVIDHAEAYVKGNIHTNGMENFWSLLKRGIKGTYVSVEPFHLFRYLDEQAFRFNTRKVTDGERFEAAIKSISGKRLTYDKLIGEGVS